MKNHDFFSHHVLLTEMNVQVVVSDAGLNLLSFNLTAIMKIIMLNHTFKYLHC